MRIRTKPWMIYYACALHGVWAVLLFADDATAKTTTLHLLSPRPDLAAVVFLACAVMAAWSMTHHVTRLGWRLALLLPQQALLVLSAWSALQAMRLSAFGDGVTRPRAFIIADQAPAVLAAILHTGAIIEHQGHPAGHDR